MPFFFLGGDDPALVYMHTSSIIFHNNHNNQARDSCVALCFFVCDQGWTSPAGGPWLHAEPHGGDDSDGYVGCCGTNVRPSQQPFTTAVVGSL